MQFYIDNLETHDNWFWDFVEHNQTHPGELEQWFRDCTPKDMIDFYRAYVWIHDSLVAPYEGLYMSNLGECLSEELQTEFNDWIVVQGKTLCEMAMVEAMMRLDAECAGEEYDDAKWESLFDIFDQCRKRPEGEAHPEATWLNVTWQPRNGHFPGRRVDDIYEERFTGFIGDKLD